MNEIRFDYTGSCLTKMGNWIPISNQLCRGLSKPAPTKVFSNYVQTYGVFFISILLYYSNHPYLLWLSFYYGERYIKLDDFYYPKTILDLPYGG